MPLGFLSSLFSLSSSATPEACARGTSRAKNYGTATSYLGLFPVSEDHKLMQNFLQSLESPFVVGGCPSISPVHLRAVRFTDLGYFFPKFLDTFLNRQIGSQKWLSSSHNSDTAAFEAMRSVLQRQI